jgi:hypothetical protein
MKPAITSSHLAQTGANDIEDLLNKLKATINAARQQSLRAVDVVQVKTCWTLGHHIVEFEQDGANLCVRPKILQYFFILPTIWPE